MYHVSCNACSIPWTNPADNVIRGALSLFRANANSLFWPDRLLVFKGRHVGNYADLSRELERGGRAILERQFRKESRPPFFRLFHSRNVSAALSLQIRAFPHGANLFEAEIARIRSALVEAGLLDLAAKGRDAA